MNDQYPQARHILSSKGIGIVAIPFLNVPQLQLIIFSLVLGYSTGWWWFGLGSGLIAVIGLATYQREFVAVRLFALVTCWVGSLWGSPAVIYFDHSNGTEDR